MKKGSITLNGLKLPLTELSDNSQELPMLTRLAARQLRTQPQQIHHLEIRKKSLDARKQGRPLFLYTVEVNGKPATPLTWPQAANAACRPLIVGAGPAGLFAGLALAEAGLQPLLIEKGQPVAERAQTVRRFWQTGQLDCNSNIQFGQGGAGAFSDGKLTSRSKDPLGNQVLRTLLAYGADPAIAYWHKPHLGSDRLPLIIENLSRRIQQLGGSFLYNTTLTQIGCAQGRLCQVTVEQNGESQELAADTLLLAPGNSARDLYLLLEKQNVAMEAKPFAVGLRIEHPQALINQAQYGDFCDHPLLTAADYQLTYRDEASGRGVYSFCMCPGGNIVNATSQAQTLVTNGASLAARNSGRANSALVVTVSPGQDFGAAPLEGMLFQQALEQQAYRISGSYALPASPAEDFLAGRKPTGLPEQFAPLSCGAVPADLQQLLPEQLTQPLCRAIRHWAEQIPGFDREGVLAGIETRTSAPVRLLRNEDRQSLSLPGLYPMGEGAGYAGGIISSAIDGLKTAYAIIERMN